MSTDIKLQNSSYIKTMLPPLAILASSSKSTMLEYTVTLNLFSFEQKSIILVVWRVRHRLCCFAGEMECVRCLLQGRRDTDDDLSGGLPGHLPGFQHPRQHLVVDLDR